jgi:hypothetical protein
MRFAMRFAAQKKWHKFRIFYTDIIACPHFPFVDWRLVVFLPTRFTHLGVLIMRHNRILVSRKYLAVLAVITSLHVLPNIAQAQTPLWGVSNAAFVSAQGVSKSQGNASNLPVGVSPWSSPSNNYNGQSVKDIELLPQIQ